MTDITVISGAVQARPPGVRWVPLERGNANPPHVHPMPSAMTNVDSAKAIRVIYQMPHYPAIVVPLFTISFAISIISVLGLLAAPLYATSVIATFLLFSLAIGLGGMAWTVAKAGRVHTQR